MHNPPFTFTFGDVFRVTILGEERNFKFL